MSVELVEIGTKGAKVWRDQTRPWRVYGAVGEGARAWALRPGLPCDDTTNSPTELVITAAGSSVVSAGAADGYPLLITTGATEYDGINAQLRGACVKLAAGRSAWLRAKVKASQANTSDLLIGVCELKTDLLKTGSAHGITASAVEGVFFHKVSGATAITVKSYKDGVEVSSVAAGTLGTVDIELAFWIDGAKVHAYIDDVEVAVFDATADGMLTPSINFRAGGAAAITLSFAEIGFVAIE